MAKSRLTKRFLALGVLGIAGSVGGIRIIRTLRSADLAGKVVLITGASRGLGYALAEEFARQGARLAICARDATTLEQAQRELTEQGADVLAIACDVARRDAVEQLVSQVTAHYGRIDILVNNAGSIMVGPLRNQALGDFEEEMAITFWGSLYTIWAVLPQMTDRHAGTIVNIASIGGKVSVPHLLPYSSAKFALVGLSEGLHAELARDGITVVTVIPGLMRTGSPPNTFVKGDHRAEYTWFLLGDSLPPLSMSARRAARQIVIATCKGSAEVILGLPAVGLSLFHGLFPGLTVNILSLFSRLLPSGEDRGTRRWRGYESETPVTQSFLSALTRDAEHTYQQHLDRPENTQTILGQ